jgi:hypothetical protein
LSTGFVAFSSGFQACGSTLVSLGGLTLPVADGSPAACPDLQATIGQGSHTAEQSSFGACAPVTPASNYIWRCRAIVSPLAIQIY